MVQIKQMVPIPPSSHPPLEFVKKSCSLTKFVAPAKVRVESLPLA